MSVLKLWATKKLNLDFEDIGVKDNQLYFDTTEKTFYIGVAKNEFETISIGSELVPATETTLGGIKIGSGLAIDQDGVVSVLGDSGFSGSYDDLSNKPSIPSKTSDLSNDAGFITANQVPQTFGFSVGADDSVLRPIGAGESIKFIGINGISTNSDLEGNITISGSYNLDTVTDNGNITTNNIGVGAITTSGNILPIVDNSLVLGSADKRWHTVFVGLGSVDIAGARLQKIGNNLAINAPLRFADSTVQSTAPHFFIAGQDSSAVKINNGETVKFLGANSISTTSDSEGNITIDLDQNSLQEDIFKAPISIVEPQPGDGLIYQDGEWINSPSMYWASNNW